MKLIIDISKEKYLQLKDMLKSDLGNTSDKIIANGTPIPDNATNGEVIDLIFPYEKTIDEVWWNTPYQKGEA